MVDNANIPDEEEYHFSDTSEEGNATEYESSAPEMVMEDENPMVRRSMFVGAVVAALILGYYMVIKPFMGEEVKPSPSSVPSFEEPAAPVAPIPTVVTPPKPVVTPTPVPTATPIASSAAVKRLSSQLEKINERLTNMDSRLLDLDFKQTQLTKRLKGLEGEVRNIKSIKKQMVKRSANTPPPPEFYLKAAVLGRAWLKAPNGSTLTVRKGDSVPGYGRVDAIDPLKGRILTSSGRIITYSPEDR